MINTILLGVFILSGAIIFWAMVGYSLSLKVLKKVYAKRTLLKDFSYEPTVTVMVVAHNEEKVIRQKIDNIVKLDYPKEKIKFLIASDNSSDKTNEIVDSYIGENPQIPLSLFKVKQRKGKTNAQNEAQKTVTSEILVMTDANSMLKENSIKELVAAFTSNDISYVCGRLIFINKDESNIANTENTYWESDIKLRKIESDIQTITAGNGAIYACRNAEYVDLDPMKSHDSNFPKHFALIGKRAIFNPDAIAYEKAGEVIEDEFKRKVRMNRRILNNILPSISYLNVFKLRWFTYFYIGHRSCRYLLWIAHLLVFLTNIPLAFSNTLFLAFLIGQIFFYGLAIFKLVTNSKNKYITLIYYYCATVLAQWLGVYNMLSGKAKPFWEKAESTR